MFFGLLLVGLILMRRHCCDDWKRMGVLCTRRRVVEDEDEGNPAGWFIAEEGRGSVDSLNCGRKREIDLMRRGGPGQFMKISPDRSQDSFSTKRVG